MLTKIIKPSLLGEGAGGDPTSISVVSDLINIFIIIMKMNLCMEIHIKG